MSLRWRLWEIIPGAVTWGALLLPVGLSFMAPAAVVIFVLLFDLYWLFKALGMAWRLFYGYRKMKEALSVNWLRLLKKIKPSPLVPDWRDIYHAVILASYREELRILRPSIQSLASSRYPQHKVILVLATEEREGARGRRLAQVLKNQFKDEFFEFLVTRHPDNIAGETKAKGANISWAGRKLVQFVKSKKILPENVIVTAADADTRFHLQYLANLTHHFISDPNRHRRSYQPLPLFSNNIWHAPALSRILAFGSTFWQLVESARPWRLVNIFAYAMSLKALIETDFWSRDVINEDSRQYWRSYFTFAGDYRVVPVFVPVSMDAVFSGGFWATARNLYLQRLRWAYGVEHSPYIMEQVFRRPEIPWYDRATKVFRFFESNFSWATSSLFIGVIGWIPIVLNPAFSDTVLAHNMPILARALLSITWVGLVISAIISLKLLPPAPVWARRHHWLVMVAQWVLVPPAILFASTPALDAQTRLMLGRYMTFRVTEKKPVEAVPAPAAAS